MRAAGTVIAVAVIALAGCGGARDQPATTAPLKPGAAAQPRPGAIARKLPAGAVETSTGREEPAGAAANEASPGVPPSGPEASGSLSGADRGAVSAAVTAYVSALDHRDAARVCSLLAPGSLPLRQLPKPRQGCASSLRASLGVPPRNGGPAWRRTTIYELKPERLGPSRARVSATVVHHFSDRRYVSVEDDVIYLERPGGRWRLAKPSGTLYRAVGYPDPPLRAFAPPRGW